LSISEVKILADFCEKALAKTSEKIIVVKVFMVVFNTTMIHTIIIFHNYHFTA
jgi:hypothetical protein